MSPYSSREPFNDDPFPRVTLHTGARHRDHLPTLDDATECRYDPRPEYNRPQHNPTNRILTHIRKNWEGHSTKTKGHLISIHLNLIKFAQESHEGEGWERYTEETLSMMNHAREVLTRLAAFEKEES